MRNPCYLASIKGNLQQVKKHIVWAHTHCTFNKDTCLHVAAENGHTAVVKYLLHYGVDPASLDAHGMTPLDFAIRRNHHEIIALLLPYYSHLNSTTLALAHPYTRRLLAKLAPSISDWVQHMNSEETIFPLLVHPIAIQLHA